MPARTLRAASIGAALVTLLLSLPALSAKDQAGLVTTMPAPDGGKPWVARADAEGTIHILYSTADGLQYAKSLDQGRTFSAATPVVDKASRKPGLEFNGCDLAVGQGGRIHAALFNNAWQLGLPKNEWGFFYACLEPGAKSFSPLRNINRQPSEGFSIAADDEGNVTACWLADKLYANVSRDNGQSFGPAVEINPAFNACDCCTTSAAYGADGKLALLYREETRNERDMHLVLWDQKRNQSSRARVSATPWKINGCPGTCFSVNRATNGFVAAWPTGEEHDIYFARLDPKGSLLPPGEIRTSGRSGDCRAGVLALCGAEGSALVAWIRNGRLGWQVYDAKGEPSGSPGSEQTSGSVVAGAVDKDGRFILFR